jgi:hypothetical protein
MDMGRDLIVAEAPAGIRGAEAARVSRPAHPAGRDPQARDELVLYVVSLYGVTNAADELVSGDALLVRPKGTPMMSMLSSILGCPIEQLPTLLARSGTWSIREMDEIDGYRVRFEP